MYYIFQKIASKYKLNNKQLLYENVCYTIFAFWSYRTIKKLFDIIKLEI